MSPYVGLAAAWVVAFFALVAVRFLLVRLEWRDALYLLREAMLRLSYGFIEAEASGQKFAEALAGLAHGFARVLVHRAVDKLLEKGELT